VLAVPVAPVDWHLRIGRDADECIALATPEQFRAIGQFYDDFTQTSDDEVMECLAGTPARAPAITGRTGVAPDPPGGDEVVEVRAGPLGLGGQLTVPDRATGIVVFAHGSGSSRHSPRNRYVAGVLNQAGLATLLFDLLTAAEEHDRTNVFDIDLLACRLVDVTGWLATRPEVSGLPVGYFGASTGAAAALWAAAEPANEIAAVVSRGGRPDLASPRLAAVAAPTLLIVGGRDDVVLDLNRQAYARLRCERRLEVVPGATHLFEEPGTLQAAAQLARDWFSDHLAPRLQPVR
jgi:putative phosphoribosyl transferase